MSNKSEGKKKMEEEGVPPIQPTYSTEIDPQEHRNELEELLKNGKIAKNQIENVKAVLQDFDNGVERAPYYQDGKRLENLDDYDPKGGALWFEEEGEMFYFGAVAFPHRAGKPHSNIINLEVRLIPAILGRTPTAAEMLRFEVLNDTGAGALSLRPTNRSILNPPQSYTSLYPVRHSRTLNGPITTPTLMVECRLYDATWSKPLGGWFNEVASLVRDLPGVPGVPRVTGKNIRQHFYFATVAGPTSNLYCALTKGSITNALPNVPR
ncbi:hypothetical protein AA313_de0207138 [Arthrobotrys entomopaga]|nr:hypothetical protein AA313_de0207138 [Arthrobotrys entomopaga]